MQLSDLVRGTSVRGSPSAVTSPLALRFGRALATQLRRRGDTRPVVVARDGDGPRLALRDAVCQGLVLSGKAVVDVGVVDGDAFAFALRHPDAAFGGGVDVAPGAGVLVSFSGESVSLAVVVGGRAVVGDALVDIARLADAGTFAVGSGMLTLAGLAPLASVAPRAADGEAA